MTSHLTLAAALVLLGGAAVAQTTPAMPPAGGAAVPTAMQPGQIRAEQLIGEDVYNAANEEIGEIEDLVIDPRSGTVVAVLIELEGALGLAQRHIAVPLSRVQMSGNDRITLNASAEEIKAMPSYQHQRRPR